MVIFRKFYFVLKRFSDKGSKILEALSALLIMLCFLALTFQVFYRFIIIRFFSFSFPFTEELARYALIWSAYLCVGMCLKEGTMASVNFIYERLGSKTKLILYCIIRIMMSVFLAIIIIYGIQVTKGNLIFKSPTLRLPGLFLYSAPVIGGVLMSYEMITELIGVLSGVLKPFEAGTVNKNNTEEVES